DLGSELVKGDEGIIFRTVAEDAEEDEIREELAWLRNQHTEMLHKASNSTSIPSLLHRQSSIIQRIYFDFFSDGQTEVVLDNSEDYQNFVRL
ncbi:ribonuclease E/G, partial [Pseudomonas sp. 2822-17]|uniref:ribonuclease E/G n=1 Tax=Pseudomonas sp. 2822-17 TaxID=1712678 RepID=UPI0015AB3DAE